MVYNNLEIHISSCKKDQHLVLNLIKNLKEFDFLKSCPIILFNDLNNPIDLQYSKEISKLGVFIFNHSLQKALKFLDKKYTSVYKYLTSDEYSHGPGQTIISNFLYPINQNKSILYLDSDIVFLNYPKNIKDFIEKNQCFFISDEQDAYSHISEDKLDPFKPLGLKGTKVNIGLYFINKFDLTIFLERIEYATKFILDANLDQKDLDENYPNVWYSSQTSMAHYLLSMGAKSLNKDLYYVPRLFNHLKMKESNLEYLINRSNINFNLVEALHLTTPIREFLEDIIFINIFYKSQKILSLDLLKIPFFNKKFREITRLKNE